YKCEEKYGFIWVNIGDEPKSLPHYSEFDDPAFRTITWGPYEMKAKAPRILENFLDCSHLAFLHEGYLGNEDNAKISDYQVFINDTITTDEIILYQPNADGQGTVA